MSLARTMTKLGMLGLSLIDVVRAVTRNPAQAIGLAQAGFGHFAVGHPAYVTLFDVIDGAFEVQDASGETRIASRRFETRGVLVRDTYHERTQPL